MDPKIAIIYDIIQEHLDWAAEPDLLYNLYNNINKYSREEYESILQNLQLEFNPAGDIAYYVKLLKIKFLDTVQIGLRNYKYLSLLLTGQLAAAKLDKLYIKILKYIFDNYSGYNINILDFNGNIEQARNSYRQRIFKLLNNRNKKYKLDNNFFGGPGIAGRYFINFKFLYYVSLINDQVIKIEIASRCESLCYPDQGYYILKFKKLETLIINNDSSSTNNAEIIAAGLGQTNITKLYTADPLMYKELINYLNCPNCKITKLKIYLNDYNDDNNKIIETFVAGNNSVTDLIFKGHVHDPILKGLLTAIIKFNKNLRSLVLPYIEGEIIELYQALEFSGLQTLLSKQNDMSSEEAAVFSKALTVNNNLEIYNDNVYQHSTNIITICQGLYYNGQIKSFPIDQIFNINLNQKIKDVIRRNIHNMICRQFTLQQLCFMKLKFNNLAIDSLPAVVIYNNEIWYHNNPQYFTDYIEHLESERMNYNFDRSKRQRIF